jgi:hypothetical protein
MPACALSTTCTPLACLRNIHCCNPATRCTHITELTVLLRACQRKQPARPSVQRR